MKSLSALSRVLIFLFIAINTCFAVRVDFVAQRSGDTVVGYFRWSGTNEIVYSNIEQLGQGKTLWNIQGAMGLNGQGPLPMTDTRLEVMNNWFIDAPIPNSIVGDQITFFGTAANGSGLQSVQNFYFRDETGLLFSSVLQPTTQTEFDVFSSVRADMFFGSGPETFTLTQWLVTNEVPEPQSLLIVVLWGGVKFVRRLSRL